MACRQPCPSCPWRIGQHADEIPNFSIDLAEGLAATTGEQLGAPVFACHQSRPREEIVCVGWLWRYGWDNIAIRLKLMRQDMRPEELDMPPEYDDLLHRTFDEVIEKLREDTVGDAGPGPGISR